MGRRTFIAGNGADRFPEGQRAAKPIGRILKRGDGYEEKMAIGMEGRRESEKRDEIFYSKGLTIASWLFIIYLFPREWSVKEAVVLELADRHV